MFVLLAPRKISLSFYFEPPGGKALGELLGMSLGESLEESLGTSKPSPSQLEFTIVPTNTTRQAALEITKRFLSTFGEVVHFSIHQKSNQ
jgi:hypothetical protein